jgi:PAS domain S-box-containing protein
LQKSILTQEDKRERRFQAEAISDEHKYFSNAIIIIDRNYNTLLIDPCLAGTDDVRPGQKCFETFQQRTETCPDCPARMAFETGQPEETEPSSQIDKHCLVGLRALPFKGAGGAQLVSLIGTDKTVYQKSAEIHDSRGEWLSSIIEASDNLIWETDENLVVRFASEGIFSILGYTPDEACGRSIFDFVNPSDADRLKDELNPIISARKSFAFIETRLIHAEGLEIFIEAGGNPIFGKKGEFCGYRCIAKNISGRKRAEITLAVERDKLKSILDSMNDGIIIISPNQQVTYANPMMEQEFGPVNAQSYHEYLHENIEPCPECADIDTINNKILIREWHCVKNKKIYEISRTAIRDANGNIASILEKYRDISKRTRAEAALHENERKFRAIFDQTFQFIGLLSTDGILLDANRSALELPGIKASDVIGKPFCEGPWWAHSKELQEKLKDAIKAAATGELIRLEVTHPDKNGNIHYVDFSLKPVKDDNGNIIFLIPEGRDITEHKMNGEVIRQNESLLRKILEILPVGLFLIDKNGVIKEINPEGQRVWGGAKYIGMEQFSDYKGWRISNGEKVKIEEWAAVKAIKNKETALNEETEIETFDGKQKTILYSAVPVLDSKGDILGAIIVNQDITERRQIEQTITKARDFYLTLFDEFPALIWRTNPDGQYDYFNKTWLDFTGRGLANEVGNGWVGGIHPDDRLRRIRAFQEAFKAEKPFQVEYRLHDYSGDYRWITDIGRPYYDMEGKFAGYIGSCYDITDRKNAEGELRDSKNFLNEMINSISDPIFVKDVNHNHILVNDAFCNLLGKEQIDIIGKTDYDLFPAENAASYWQTDDYVVNSWKEDIKEETVVGADGNNMIIVIKKTLYIDDYGNKYVVGISRDITERIKMEISLRDSEARTRAITESAQDAIIIMDASGNISYWNPAAEKILGYEAREALGQNLHYFISPKRYHETFDRAFPQFARTGQGNAVGKTLELYAQKKDGKEISVELSMSAVQIGGGWHAVGIMRDISQRKRVEDALKESEEKFRVIASSALDAIVMMDEEGKLIFWNNAAERIFGFSEKEAIGQNIQILLAPSNKRDSILQRFNNMKGDTPESETGETIELDAVHKSGKEFPAELSLSAMMLQEKRYLVGIIRDISELRRSKAQLVQSEKLAAIGTLAAGVAHEINNPIGYINSNLNTLAKYAHKVKEFLGKNIPPENSDRQEMEEILNDCGCAISESLEGTSRVKKIVADLKSFSRIDRAEKEFANINEGIESTLNIVWNELKYKCKVEKQLGQLPELFCIPNQLNQVFMNLLVNAGQAITNDKGLIVIKTWADQGNIFISIKDNGSGIPKENMNKIFEAFFTTKEVGKGTGLGLSLVYDIIKKHNGKIDVESTVGVGTEFVVTFPIEGGING